MNERIKELAEQATTIEYGADHGFDRVTFDKEKFAELIVQECYVHCSGQLMDKKLTEAHGLTYNDGVMDCAVGLKQHFGVEE